MLPDKPKGFMTFHRELADPRSPEERISGLQRDHQLVDA